MQIATDADTERARPNAETWFGELSRAILESALDCIIVMDASGRVLEFNPAAERVFGFTRAEAIGAELAELIVPPALRERHRNGLKRYLETGQRTMLGRRVEIEALRADGSQILVELTITVFRMNDAPVFTAYLRDITNRNQAEEKLRLSEERYRRFFEEALTGNFVSTPEGTIVACNSAFAKMLGFSSMAGVQKVNAASLYPKHASREAFLSLLSKEKQLLNWESDLLRRDGEIIHVVENVFGAFDETGKLEAIHGYLYDVTETRRAKAEQQAAETQRRESEQRFRELAENIDEVFWMSDAANTELLYISPAYETIWGRTRASLYASPTSWMDAIHPEDKERIVRLRAQGQPRSPRDNTYRIIRPDNSIRWIRDRGFPVRDEGGIVVRFAGIAEDITEQKEIEIEINRHRAQLQEAQRVAGLGFWTWDIKANHVTWSDELCRIIGRTPQEFGATLDGYCQYLHPDDRSRRERELKAARETGNGFDSDVRIFRPDGTTCVLQSRAHVVRDANGQPAHVFGTALDITDRKKTEEALAAQGLRYKTLMETAKELIYVLDENGYLQEANEAFLSGRGFSREDIGRLNVADWDPLVTPEIFQQRIRAGSAIFETKHRAKDGTLFDVEVSATAVKIAGERLIFCVTRDITERKLAAEKLWQSVELFRAISEGATEAIFAKDLRRRYLMINTAGARLVGRTPEEVVGTKDADLFTAKDSACIEALEREVLQSGEIRTYDETVISSGVTRIYNTTKGPIRDSKGQVIGLWGVARDITERKREEEKLRESEQRFQEMADNIGEVFWCENVEPFHMLYISSAYETIWGRSRESFYSSPESWIETIHPEDKSRILTTIADPKQRETPFEMTYRIIRPDESVRWIRSRRFSVRDENGTIVRMVGVTSDITESKLAADALEHANRQLSILSRHRTQVQEKERRHLARELHDQIGQALTAAKINVQSAQRSTKREMVRKYLEDTVSILDQILDEARRISLNLRPPALDDLGLAPALRWALADYARLNGWSAQFFADPQLGRAHPDIEIACFRVAQEALTNVVRHAKAHHVSVELREKDEVLHLLVRDDGAGFAPTDRQRRGYREPLGLIGMRERVSAVGGKFECQSAPGAGTIIEAFFPMANNLATGE